LAFVRELATESGASVVAFHVRELLVGPRSYGLEVHVDDDDMIDKIRAQAAELCDAGIAATTETIAEHTTPGVAQAIAAAAEAADADVIVVGTRGHSALGGLLVGSVTQRLLHVTDRPVLVVPVRVAVEAAS
jgi:nucleotide-binding universal stress UspA family protein